MNYREYHGHLAVGKCDVGTTINSVPGGSILVLEGGAVEALLQYDSSGRNAEQDSGGSEGSATKDRSGCARDEEGPHGAPYGHDY